MAHILDHTRPLTRQAAPRFPGLRTMIALARQRRALASLDDVQLADIGLSADDAQHEAGRAPWDVPAHWRG